MPRNKKCRNILFTPEVTYFKPQGIPMHQLETVVLDADEIEALRLSGKYGFYQVKAAQKMGISRQTYSRILRSAWQKTTEALLSGKALCINIKTEHVTLINSKKMKKIAIPTQDKRIDSHFGHCETVTIFTIDDNNNIQQEEKLKTPVGCGCKSNLIELLLEKDVTVLLSAGIGMGAVSLLNSAGISVYSGYDGEIHEVLKTFLNGNFGTDDTCAGHSDSEHGHSCHHN